MKDDINKTPEQIAKEEAYKEYLRLREEHPDHPRPSITDTPYRHSFMPEPVRPCTKTLFAKINRKISGAEATRKPAVIWG